MPTADAPVPAGIGECRRCAYLETGSAEICYRCARKTIEPLPPVADRCGVCDQTLERSGKCGNKVCSWKPSDRYFQWNFAIAMRSGILSDAISALKYNNRFGWRDIFGRVLVGFLDDQEMTFEDFDLIVASPTFLDQRGARRYEPMTQHLDLDAQSGVLRARVGHDALQGLRRSLATRTGDPQTRSRHSPARVRRCRTVALACGT